MCFTTENGDKVKQKINTNERRHKNKGDYSSLRAFKEVARLAGCSIPTVRQR